MRKYNNDPDLELCSVKICNRSEPSVRCHTKSQSIALRCKVSSVTSYTINSIKLLYHPGMAPAGGDSIGWHQLSKVLEKRLLSFDNVTDKTLSFTLI